MVAGFGTGSVTNLLLIIGCRVLQLEQLNISPIVSDARRTSPNI